MPNTRYGERSHILTIPGPMGDNVYEVFEEEQREDDGWDIVHAELLYINIPGPLPGNMQSWISRMKVKENNG